MKIYKLLLILITAITISSCTTANNRQETVVVNGEQVTKAELEKIVNSIFHENIENRLFVRWEKTDEEIYCRVIGLTPEQLKLFQNVFNSLVNETGVNISGCPAEETEPVRIVYLFSDSTEALIKFPLTQALLSPKSIEHLSKYQSIIQTKKNKQNIVFSLVVSTLPSLNDQELITEFSRYVLLSMLDFIYTERIIKYEMAFIQAFLRSYYTVESERVIFGEAISKITNHLFTSLKERRDVR